MRQVGLDAYQTREIRAPTGRKELRYHNVGLRNSAAVHVFVHNLVFQSYNTGVVQADSRVIVFCSTVNDAQETSAKLGCLQYHGKMEREERSNVQRTWMEGTSAATRCIAATSAFVHGIDAPYVDLIVFLNPPYGAIDFMQASARGGRRGRPAMVVLAHYGSTLKVEEPDYAMHAVMNDYTSNQVRCRRAILAEAMDGFGMKCNTDEGDQACDICQTDSEMIRLLKRCALMGPLQVEKCLTKLQDARPEPEPTDEEDDEYMYAGIDDAAIAAMEMPNSFDVQQVSLYTNIYFTSLLIGFNCRPFVLIQLQRLGSISGLQMHKQSVLSVSNSLPNSPDSSQILRENALCAGLCKAL